LFANIEILDFLFNISSNFDELNINKAGSLLFGLFKNTNEHLLLIGKNKRPFKLDIKFIE
jgi:hypothetical protein